MANSEINDDLYLRLKAAWMRHKSIRAAAMEAGCSPATASKYINKPVLSDGRLGIRAGLQGALDKQLKELDDTARKVASLSRELFVGKLNEVITKIQKVELVIDGPVNAAGNTIVNEHRYRRLLTIAQNLFDAVNEAVKEQKRMVQADGRYSELPEQDAPESPDGGTQADNAKTRTSAWDIIQRFEQEQFRGFSPDERASAERGLTESLTKATLRVGGRAPTQTEQSGKPGDAGDEEEALIYPDE